MFSDPVSEVIYRDFKHVTEVGSPTGRLLELQTSVCRLEVRCLGCFISPSRMRGDKNLLNDDQ